MGKTPGISDNRYLRVNTKSVIQRMWQYARHQLQYIVLIGKMNCSIIAK